jgi:hypothetical protein
MVDAANQSVNFATVFSSTGDPACANATNAALSPILGTFAIAFFAFSSVGFSLRPHKNTPSTHPSSAEKSFFRRTSGGHANCHATDCSATLLPALVRIRTALTEIEQAANRISPLLVYILEVTRGRYFAPKYSF